MTSPEEKYKLTIVKSMDFISSAELSSLTRPPLQSTNHLNTEKFPFSYISNRRDIWMPEVMERDLLLPWVLLHVYGHYQSWGKRSHVSLQYSPQELLPSGSFLHLYKWICMLMRLFPLKTRR